MTCSASPQHAIRAAVDPLPAAAPTLCRWFQCSEIVPDRFCEPHATLYEDIAADHDPEPLPLDREPSESVSATFREVFGEPSKETREW